MRKEFQYVKTKMTLINKTNQCHWYGGQTIFSYIKHAELVSFIPRRNFHKTNVFHYKLYSYLVNTCRTWLLHSRELAKIAEFCLSRNIIEISFDVYFNSVLLHVIIFVSDKKRVREREGKAGGRGGERESVRACACVCVCF